MKGERSSRTAMMVAGMRAMADAGASHVRDFHDPTARVFLNERWTRRLAKVEQQLREKKRTALLAYAATASDMMALRTSTIDAAVRAAIASGTRQVVILGAGFDGRAWRMPELAGVRVFEVDHPATQAAKRSHLDALPSTMANVEFVSIDFERESLDAVLARAGHDPTRPTCWIWEGVIMYLTLTAMRATLGIVSLRSSPGSTLIVNYHTTMRGVLVRLILWMVGEPVRSKWTPDEMAADLHRADFEIVDESGVVEWAKRFATGEVQTRAGRVMRIVVARRM